MTLNDLEHSPFYFAFFLPNLIALLTNYVTMVEDRPVVSVNIVSQFQSSTFGHNYVVKKDYYSFPTRRMFDGALVPEISGQIIPVKTKTQIFNPLVAPQP